MTKGKKILLIDVTLRDGGYKNNFNFNEDIIYSIVSLLSQSGIEYIELGYKNGTNLYNSPKKLGATFDLEERLIADVIESNNNMKFSVMIHPSRITENDLKILRDCRVSLVRCCFPMDDVQLGFKCIEQCKKNGLKVSTNFTRVSKISIDKLVMLSREAENRGTDIVYYADSNGSVLPYYIGELFDAVNEHVSVPKGFHAHNNIELALINSIEAINCGIEYLDASVRGMGKGNGNLKLEVIANYLNKNSKKYSYSIFKIIQACKLLEAYPEYSGVETSLDELLFGIFDINMDKRNFLRANDGGDIDKLMVNITNYLGLEK